ncbi:hypothetical protein SLEP1_g46971 [Rubroshorea leprosula]|uniref:Uncharacterized protein n=1 Tax=Rubroshorea leprosula TaxID=152421 RepID=A0AAV5LRP1_9ROSI|nr:hypothetical protein SLEP1_g46971 [Rubroshorea leprosula]
MVTKPFQCWNPLPLGVFMSPTSLVYSTCPVASQSGNKSKLKSSYPSLKPKYLQSPWLGISLFLRSSNPNLTSKIAT